MLFAKIDGASTNNTIVTAPTGDLKIIVVHQLFMVGASAVNIKFQAGASGTDLTGAMPYAANGGIVLPYNREGWFETSPSTLLNMNLSSGVQVSGALGYSLR